MKMIDPNDFYELKKEKKEKYLTQVKRYIEKEGSELEKKMMAVVEKQVNEYKSDFYIHDLHRLKSEKNIYIWAIRETGTWIIPIEYDLKKSAEIMKAFLKNIKTQQENHIFYLINNKNNTIKKLNENELNRIQFKYKYKDEHKMLKNVIKKYHIDYYQALNAIKENINQIHYEKDLEKIIKQIKQVS